MAEAALSLRVGFLPGELPAGWEGRASSNAFNSGQKPDDTVVAIWPRKRGTLISKGGLQGSAHEFCLAHTKLPGPSLEPSLLVIGDVELLPNHIDQYITRDAWARRSDDPAA